MKLSFLKSDRHEVVSQIPQRECPKHTLRIIKKIIMNGIDLSFQEINHKVRADIERYGWSIVASEVEGVLFTHTVGLNEQFEHPDLETIGLPEELACAFLNELARWVKGGVKLEVGEKVTELVDNFEFMLVTNPFDPSGTPCTNGRLRLIWQDGAHQYPWDPGCDDACFLQTILPESPTSPHDLNTPAQLV